MTSRTASGSEPSPTTRAGRWRTISSRVAKLQRKEGTAMENVEIARVLKEYADLLDI
jgi:hypothetical protein